MSRTYVQEKQLDKLFQLFGKELETQKPDDPIQWLKERLATFEMENPKEKRPEDLVPPSPASAIEARYPPELKEKALTVVVFGASGDLAKKKTYPALYHLFLQGLLPPHTTVFGYARRKFELEDFREQISQKFTKKNKAKVAKFLSMCEYVSGAYDDSEAFARLDEAMVAKEKEKLGPAANRLFYLALPAFMFSAAGNSIKQNLMKNDGWNRVVVEKPFGRDLDSSNKLAAELGALFREEQVYRIDHYLGKEMVQNFVVFRFANKVLSSVWSHECISNVQITFKEPFGTEGRGGYFDQYGIIRDILQNHLLQIMSLVAMEKPKSLDAEDIRNEKVHVLHSTPPAKLENCVLGQYVKRADGTGEAYLDDETVPKDSVTPTFCSMVLYIENDRWQGVPFILKAGKALDERKAEVRIQFKNELQPYRGEASRNELVMRVQPGEAIYLKMMAKLPGLSTSITQTELDLSYSSRYHDVSLPDAYEGLIYEVLRGNQSNFVRTDELEAAWKIFTPLLHKIETDRVKPVTYEFGGRGPKESDDLARRVGYVRDGSYRWSPVKAAM
eukprot:TRINITY_DN60072_c0_g1_i1.p1 TRINITY_DN60072_c0_g1~~TRINITY_DN60072_c0_g1_i1.p1  ORF type:complete len:558 (+),score=41.27 TRINITY_DN60072_c0_g1_i1:691-2364(+)